MKRPRKVLCHLVAGTALVLLTSSNCESPQDSNPATGGKTGLGGTTKTGTGGAGTGGNGSGGAGTGGSAAGTGGGTAGTGGTATGTGGSTTSTGGTTAGTGGTATGTGGTATGTGGTAAGTGGTAAGTGGTAAGTGGSTTGTGGTASGTGGSTAGTTAASGRFIDTYQPKDPAHAAAWKSYITNEIKALTVGTGGNGEAKTITNTILVLQGTTYDGKGEKITAKGMGDGSQAEAQQPFFLLEPGATLKNVTFTAPGVEGVHMMGDNTLEKIVWEDVGEDAASVRSYFPGGSIHIKDSSAKSADDKIFQFNRSCIVWMENVTASNMGKFIRTNNGTEFPFEFYLDNVSVSGVTNVIMKVNRSDHTVYLYKFSGSGGWEGGIKKVEYGGGGPTKKP